MNENNQTQFTLESGGVQAETKSKKKWKIPRVSKSPLCLSMYEWAVRLSLSDMILGIGMAILFFWLSTRIDFNDESYQATHTVLIVFGVIFCIISFFGLLLFIGLVSKKFKVLLRVYCWYASILGVTIFLLFLAIGIFAMASLGEIGSGFLLILVGVLLSGYILYIDCVVYSIYMNIIENKEELNLKKSGC